MCARMQCGVVFTIKGKGFHISIWNKKARAVEDRSALTEEFNSHPMVAAFLKEQFKSQEVPVIALSYRPHKVRRYQHQRHAGSPLGCSPAVGGK